MVTFKKTSRFYTRNSAGKYQMDVGELRSAFAASELLGERMHRFRTERLSKIIAGETPVQFCQRLRKWYCTFFLLLLSPWRRKVEIGSRKRLRRQCSRWQREVSASGITLTAFSPIMDRGVRRTRQTVTAKFSERGPLKLSDQDS